MPRKYAIVILLLAFALGLTALVVDRFGRPDMAPVASTGAALVGGPFTLTDQTGATVTDKTYLGKPALIYFGYTFCPDVCPTELQVMIAALDELGPDGADIQPIFVTIDPERDTQAVMAAYVANFGPRLIGLTGTADQIATIAKAYRVYYGKADDSGSSSDYLMDHSSIIYLMGPDGKFIKHFSYGTDAKALADAIRAALGR